MRQEKNASALFDMPDLIRHIAAEYRRSSNERGSVLGEGRELLYSTNSRCSSYGIVMLTPGIFFKKVLACVYDYRRDAASCTLE